MKVLLQLFVLLSFSWLSDESSPGNLHRYRHGKIKKNIICLFHRSSARFEGVGKFEIEDINPELCTHIIYSSAALNSENNTISPSEPDLDIKQGGYRKLNGLRASHPELKTLISVSTLGDLRGFTEVVDDKSSQDQFASSVTSFIDQHGFDGLDIDLQYEQSLGHSPLFKERFIQLLKKLRMTFNARGLILSVSVPWYPWAQRMIYVLGLMNYVDFVNLMAFDTKNPPATSKALHKASMHPHEFENTEDLKFRNVAFMVANWLDSGANRLKINLGISAYGLCYTLADPSVNTVGSPVTGFGNCSQYSSGHTVSYNELCERKKPNSGWTVKDDIFSNESYMYQGDKWITFDDPTSVGFKASYSQTYHLGGVYFYGLEFDDFHGSCGNGTYPLLHSVQDELYEDELQSNLTTVATPGTDETTDISIQNISSQSKTLSQKESIPMVTVSAQDKNFTTPRTIVVERGTPMETEILPREMFGSVINGSITSVSIRPLPDPQQENSSAHNRNNTARNTSANNISPINTTEAQGKRTPNRTSGSDLQPTKNGNSTVPTPKHGVDHSLFLSKFVVHLGHIRQLREKLQNIHALLKSRRAMLHLKNSSLPGSHTALKHEGPVRVG